MESSRPSRSQKRQGFRSPLDRRVDKWIETGRQFVDGVSGTRPGMRRINSTSFNTSSFQKVGRWVGDKLDWLLEDEDEWLEPWQSENEGSASLAKKPLDAISKRVSSGPKLSSNSSTANQFNEEWPEESSFRIDRWQRGSSQGELGSPKSKSGSQGSRESWQSDSRSRPLPRSSRKRN